MNDKEKLIAILNIIGVDDWYSNEEIAEKMIAYGVTCIEVKLKGGAE